MKGMPNWQPQGNALQYVVHMVRGCLKAGFPSNEVYNSKSALIDKGTKLEYNYSKRVLRGI